MLTYEVVLTFGRESCSIYHKLGWRHCTDFTLVSIVRRENSAQKMMMDEDVEQASLLSFNDRPRAFPNMRSKTYSPLVSAFLLRCVSSLRFDIKKLTLLSCYYLFLLAFLFSSPLKL